MKKVIYAFAALFIYTGSIFAQPCGTSGPSQCSATGMAYPGLAPRSDSLPPFTNGIASTTVIQFKNYNTALYSGFTVTVQSLRIDSIENLPSGLCWATDKTNNTYTNQESGCIKINGTPCSQPGQYKLRIWVYVTATAPFPLGTVSLLVDAASVNLKYFLRVGNFGDVVPACDTLQTVPLYTVGYSPTANCSPNLCPQFTFTQSSTGSNSCAAPNGTINVTASGGTGPYTYYLGAANNTTGHFMGVGGGSHDVIAVDAATCRDTVTVTVSSTTPVITVTTNSTTAQKSCTVNNGAFSVTAGGGTGPYNYAIPGISTNTTGNFSPLAAGTYTVTATDANQCSGTGAPQVRDSVPVINVTKVSDTAQTLCVGHNGAVVLSAAGGQSPYSYSILGVDTNTTGVFTGMASGAYAVNVIDANSCHGAYSGTITQNLATVTVSVVKTNASTSGASDGTATATPGGGTGPYTYAWSGTSQTTGAVTGLAVGPYSVTVTDTKGCSASGSVAVSFNLAVNSLGSELSDLQIFPNPAVENITVKAHLISTRTVTIEILNLMGQKVQSRIIGSTDKISENFNLKGLAKGSYFVKIIAGEKLASYPIVVE